MFLYMINNFRKKKKEKKRYTCFTFTTLTNGKNWTLFPANDGAPHSLTSFVLSQSQCITKVERPRV